MRKIIKIDKEKCNGCNLCVDACHEGAIGMVEGKATLLRDDYCDGLGDCLPVCPTGAISFEEREALEYNEKEVQKNISAKNPEIVTIDALPCGCPGTNARAINRDDFSSSTEQPIRSNPLNARTINNVSALAQWPVQIKLVPTKAEYFEGAKLLIAADCSAYAYAGFHEEFIRGKICLIGCPKLDSGDYSEKLTEILKLNNIKDVTVVRMEVPCCGGIEQATKTALKNCEKMIPWRVVTISTDGRLVEN